MRIRRIILAAFLATLITGGYIWYWAAAGAAARATWLAEPIPSDSDTEGISLTACGFLNRDVQVTIYRFGEEDRAAEDFWVEEKSHGDFAAEFYRRGFRRVVATSSKISRVISIRTTPQDRAKPISTFPTSL